MRENGGAERPIGVFDSGLGGLTAVRQLRRILPGEDIVYFGDTGRVPYGTRGRDTILRYARQDIAFLLSRGVKCVLAACGTVSSTLPEEEARCLPVMYMGVVRPAAAAAAAATRNGRIGIMATEATVRSGSYQRMLADMAPNARTFAQACPLLVPLVENGRFAPGDRLAEQAVEEYTEPMIKAGVDTLILGCTHYPLLHELIARRMGGQVTAVDTGREAALALREKLAERGLLRAARDGGGVEYNVSDDAARFDGLAGIFLGEAGAKNVRSVDIEQYGAARGGARAAMWEG